MLATNRFLIILAVGVALVAAGCGSSKKKSSSASSSTTTSTTTGTTTSPSSAAASTVALSANPTGALTFDKTDAAAKAGKVTIVMKNPSSSGVQHGIAIEGNSVDKDGAIVQPGKTSRLTVTLKADTYEFYCPFDGHKAQGMKGTLTVGSSSGTSSSGSSTGGSSGGSSSTTSSGSHY